MVSVDDEKMIKSSYGVNCLNCVCFVLCELYVRVTFMTYHPCHIPTTEATHAWIKLHPNFPYTTPLPLKVEEGICQLVAFLFLNDGLDPIDNTNSSSHSSSVEEDKSIPSDEKLRQYFRFCIETDEGVYGEGFRLAARAYAKMGMQELLYHVAMHHDFPPLYGES